MAVNDRPSCHWYTLHVLPFCCWCGRIVPTIEIDRHGVWHKICRSCLTHVFASKITKALRLLVV